jgi:hypothetical protein
MCRLCNVGAITLTLTLAEIQALQHEPPHKQ